jgi:hypothetical protein
MEIVINPVATRVWRTASSLQIGLGDDSVVLENLEPRHESMIQALYSGLTASQTKDYGRHLKMRASEVQALISALRPVLLKQTERSRATDSTGKTLDTEIEAGEIAPVASVSVESELFQGALGEMNQASLKFAARAETVWLRRQNSAVFISSLDRTGRLIAEGLAAAGVGVLVSGDITERHVIATQELLSALPGTADLVTLPELSERQIGRLDLAILLGQQIIEPQKFAAWMNRGTPQLAAIFASAAEKLQPLVSHVIVAGHTPCWVCFEMGRCARDSAWPQIASQLIGREQRFDSASSRLLLAGQVLSETLDHLDRRNGFSAAASGPLWSFSPECSCRLGVSQT